MGARITAVRGFRPGFGSTDPAGSMGDAFWAHRKQTAEQRMRAFDRESPRVRDIANATGFIEAAAYFQTADEAERAIAHQALLDLEQSFHVDVVAAQAEVAGITRKPRIAR